MPRFALIQEAAADSGEQPARPALCSMRWRPYDA
jgi:hypothetical protein